MTSSTAGPPPAAGPRADDLLTALRGALGETYEIERLLGAGGMGSVFLGRDRTLDRLVAIKVIVPELAAAPAIRERFLQEARTVARLRHPNIVAVYAAGEAAGMLYFVMEYVPGESLRDRVARDGRLDGPAGVAVVRDLARALAYAHAQGVVHRDVKPENVLLDRDTGRAMLTDFGVARALAAGGDGRLTGTGFVLGSPRYMSPEQAAGERELDGRSDVYSLGLVAYEMFAGEPAITATSAPSILMKQLTEKPAPLVTRGGQVPPGVAAVIDRALEKEPDARFPTADAMADAIESDVDAWAGAEIAGSRARSGRTGPAAAAAGRRPSGRRGLAGAALGFAAVAALAGGWWVVRGRDGVPSGVDPRKSYYVAPFEVQSADPQLAWLREGSANMLSLNLAQWRDLTVVDYERGLDLLRDLELDGARRIGLEDARRLARRAGAWTVVTGQVSGTPDSLFVTAKLYAVESGARLDEAQRAAPRSADPRAVFDALARDLLDLAGAPASVAVARLAETTTSSVEAYRDYLEGTRALNAWRLDEADSLLARATRLDTTFALAYYKRALTLGWSRQGDTAQAGALRGAQAHAARLPGRERALLAAYVDLSAALAGEMRGDTAGMHAAFEAAQQKYAAAVARDSADAEAWYGLGDAYWHHRPDGWAGARAVANWNRALRAFDRTLALDSSFHLAYSHKLDLYQQAAGRGSPLVLDGDSILRLDGDAARRAFGEARLAAAKQRAQREVTRQARAWTLADPVPQAYRALALAHSAAGQFDSAAAAAAEGARRLGARAGTLPFLQAALQMRVDPAGALATLRATLRSADTAALAANGGADRFFFVVRAMDVASLAGSARDVDAVAGLAAAVQPTMPGTAYPTATMTRWMAAAQRLAMGMPGPGPRLGVDSAIAAVERAPERVAQAARWQLSNIPYVAFATTRDPRYLATFRRWRGDDTSAYPELDALAALAGGDTAAAQRAARQFPSADSTRAAGTGWLNPSRWAARAAVLAELGDVRGALATYEVLDPTRFSESGPMDPGWAVYARTFLARGRLYEQLGERAKAAAAYERFLTLWKDADPALQPQLREARAGLARVRDAQGTQPVGGA